MNHSDAEIFVGLLAAVAVLAQIGDRLRIPYPVVLVLGGLALGFVPGLPAPELDPDVFFFFVLPPLLYSEAYLFSTEHLRAHALEIGLLAVGLVVTSAAAVALVAHEVAGLPWAAAFVLGAVVGPTDPVAATAVIHRFGVPQRIATILEGESLVNDATALVVYRFAIAAAVTGVFSPADAVLEFVKVSFGGVLVGWLVWRLAAAMRRWVTVMEVEVTLSLLLPFVAYLPAERLHVSGVLAAVTAGLLIGRQEHLSPAGTRLRRHAFWEVLAFLLNATLFLLIGLALPAVLHRLGSAPAVGLVGDAALIAATVIGLRFAWMFVAARAALALRPERPTPSELVVLGWSGMRGGVSLAAALAVPVMAGGHPFPGRAQIIFFAYVVVLATIVVPGLTLGPLIERLGVGSGAAQARADARARAHILRAAIEHIGELAHENELPEEIAERLRALYESRLDGLAPRAAQDGDGLAEVSALHARRAAVAAQRAALAELVGRQQIGAVAAREVERELDFEESLCR